MYPLTLKLFTTIESIETSPSCPPCSCHICLRVSKRGYPKFSNCLVAAVSGQCTVSPFAHYLQLISLFQVDMNLFVLRQANLAALSVFLLLLQRSVQSVDVANSTVAVSPDPTTSAASLAPSRQYPILTSCREYINAQWSAFETELEQHEELFASRDLYLIVLLQSLLQSRLAVPEPYRSLAPLTSFLSSYGLLPRLVDLDDVTALLEDYSAAFSRFLADPATHFNRLWVPIPVEARPLFRHLKPTKDTTRMFGDVIDQLVAAYIRHASGVGESEKDIDRQWAPIQRKAEILVTVVPRYYLVLRYLTSIHGNFIKQLSIFIQKRIISHFRWYHLSGFSS